VRPLSDLPAAETIRGVCFDIDDTFTRDGRVVGAAFTALERWQASGRRAVAVTGRPAGWCDHFARMWPIDAVVGENGAFWFAFDSQTRKILRADFQSANDRNQTKSTFNQVVAAVLARFPAARLASDQAYRASDLAIDFAEDCGPLSLSDAQDIAQIMRGFGMTAKISSIHVNGWFGRFDKSSTTQSLFESHFGISPVTLKDSFLYVGDSPNDSPMFSFFPLSVGVANVRRYGDVMTDLPKFVSRGESASGFIEVLDHVLGSQAA